jgi:hypothetical protein
VLVRLVLFLNKIESLVQKVCFEKKERQTFLIERFDLSRIDYSPFVIYMRRNRIGGISVKHNQQYIDENSNYDDLWERFVTITDIHNGYEFAFDEVNETIYWTQIKSFLPDGTPTVKDSFSLHKKKQTLIFSMKFVELVSMVQMKLFSTAMMRF